MSIVLTVLICCFSSKLLPAQDKNNASKAIEFLKQADTLADQESYKESNEKALQAALEFKAAGDWDKYQESYDVIFRNALFTKNYSPAILSIKKGLNLIPETSQSALGHMNFYLGYIHEVIGENFTSLKYYNASSDFFYEAQDTFMLSYIYTNLGIGYTQTGDYTKAINLINNALVLARKENDRDLLNRIFKNLGRAYYHKGDLKEAEEAYREAQLLKDPHDGTFEDIKARLQLEQGKFNEAIVNAKLAIELSEMDWDINDAEKLLGEIYLKKGDYEKANTKFLEVLSFYDTLGNKRELGKIYVLLGETYKELNRLDEALKYYQIALTTFLPEFINEDPTSNPDVEQFTGETEIWLMEIFRGKGTCFFKKYHIDQTDNWLYLAEKQFQLAVRCIHSVKLAFTERESKIATRAYSNPFYEDLIKTKLELFNVTQQKKYQEEAFLIAQEANAFVLRELLNEQQAFQIANVSKDKIDLLKYYREQQVKLNYELEEAPEKVEDSLQMLVFNVKREQAKLKERIEKEHPLFARLRSDLKGEKSGELRKNLDDSEVLIKYFMGEKTLYIFSLSHSKFGIDTIPLPADFDAMILRYRRATSDIEFVLDSLAFAEQEYLVTAYRLFKILLEKPLKNHSALQKIHHLTIVADDIINTISFVALLMNESDNWSGFDNCIVSKYAVNYLYYCKMLTQEEHQANGTQFISFGLEFDDNALQHLQKISQNVSTNKAMSEYLRSGKLSRLPFSDDEARELASIMGGEPKVNRDATKANFLELSIQADFIHLATHSLLDEDNPDRSALVFARTKDSSDYLLRIEEIYDLSLNADMIVLSACSSGFGKNHKGEGLNSLARAFNFSGVSSIMATFWNISDEASKKIMLLYYDFLLEGFPKDIALQKAQLEYLGNDEISSPAFRLPVYWAAWKPIGQRAPISSKGRNPLSVFLLLFIFCLTTGIIYLQKRKNSAVS